MHRTSGKKHDPQAETLRAASRDVRRAHRIRTGANTTVLIDVADLRLVLNAADEDTYLALRAVLGPHTADAVAPGRVPDDPELSA